MEEPVWVAQWPLSSEKLLAAHKLVEEQVALGHVRPSVSPWNTPIFVIKKKSGKWRLLYDLRAINAQMQIMGPVQRGLPLLSTLPAHWPIMVIDIKDCFFSIPLHSADCEHFAFTVPSCNHEEPDQRYEWVVLPQGMANSPTMCQLFVGRAIAPVKKGHPKLRVVHYMDDILIAHKEEAGLQKAYAELVFALREQGLYPAPEKIQTGRVVEYLGAKIHPRSIMPQKLTLRKDNLKTLNDFQKLLGDINWIKGYLKLPNYELRPLFDMLKGDLNSPRDLTESARFALKRVEEALSATCLNRLQDGQPFDLCILPTETQPTGVLWQEGPLMWLHSHVSPGKALEYYPEAVAGLALQGVQQSLQFFGVYPHSIIVPYNAYQVQTLCATINNWSILRCMFPGDIDNHLPKDPLLRFVKEHPVIFPKVTAQKPIGGAINIFTDGSKTGCGVYVAGNQDPVQHQFVPGNPQIVELMIVIEVFKAFPCPFNLISDSAYVINALKILEAVGTIKATSSVLAPFTLLQSLIWQRKEPFFPMHIRAYTGLPGPLTKGNALADAHTRAEWVLHASSVDLAKDFHAKFHVNARTLQSRFSLSRADAHQVVKECPRCIIYHKPPTFGVNPRGLRPLQVWQMDVTHVPEFGRLKYLHVSVDTFSGVILATPLSGEKATDVISHCLGAWVAWGMPKQLKTDNGPAYTG
ncbi:PREDICTED: endogenous retrovirus group K member 8 Pol protein-like [Dipodomys ordii]|uniref:Endogenous retrovirus group K member 8 Pol protein-like n=1 Tax=Dipodomys ordii TaxID=10020 RepID=A0A1S3G2S8_DIPOR|nr:PREDICTED: endogenous retrovirus group K member 8 Pol protein-like [Dipodomys ordii]